MALEISAFKNVVSLTNINILLNELLEEHIELFKFFQDTDFKQSFHLNPIASNSNISCNVNQSFREHNLFSYKLETCYKG